MKTMYVTAAVLGLSFCASADVVGTFDIGGSTATVSSSSINFNCDLPPSAIPGSCPSNTGNALIDNATGDMSPFFLEGITVQDLVFPLGTPINVPNWLNITPSIFNGTLPAITFDLTFLPLGVFSPAECFTPAAPGETCTPAGSNFNLENTTTGFTASFDVLGNTHFLDGSEGTFTGTFTSTVNGENYQQALATVMSGGTVTETYTASFALLSAVPEPSYMAGLAILGLAISAITFYRERQKRGNSRSSN